MADELYPGYDPMIDPNPITCWGHPTAEQKEAFARREHERLALWVWGGDVYYEIIYYEIERMCAEATAQAKAELWEREPWMRKYPELFQR